MARRLAVFATCLLTLVPAWCQRLVARPSPPVACAPEGRGGAPRHWIGCAADPGPPRPLLGAERLAAGLPVDVNAASAEDLAAVPGLSPRLAAAVVEEREQHGMFACLEDLLRVRGIGPVRLARARPHLALKP